ncbi:hypothetical protein PAMP_024651 [Pampus punctatissimus]
MRDVPTNPTLLDQWWIWILLGGLVLVIMNYRSERYRWSRKRRAKTLTRKTVWTVSDSDPDNSRNSFTTDSVRQGVSKKWGTMKMISSGIPLQ